jgi:hypothetical protein
VGRGAAVCIYIQADPILAVSLSHPQSHETTLDHLSWEQDMPWSRDFGIEDHRDSSLEKSLLGKSGFGFAAAPDRLKKHP